MLGIPVRLETRGLFEGDCIVRVLEIAWASMVKGRLCVF